MFKHRVNKNKLIPVFAFLILLGTCVNSYAGSDSGDGGGSFFNFQLLFDGGLGYADNSDVNNDVEMMADDFTNYVNAAVGTSLFDSNQKRTADLAYGINLEARFFFSFIGVGAGWGMNWAKAEFESTSDGYVDNLSTAEELEIMPFTVTLYFKFNMSERSRFIIGVGGGYYRGELERTYERVLTIAPFSTNISQSYEGNAFGYHAKLEYNYQIGGAFCFYAGILGRYAQIDNFEDDNGNELKDLNNQSMEAGLSGVYFYFGFGLSI